MLFFLYSLLLTICKPYLNHVLKKRLANGKEDILRFSERKGIPSVIRPQGEVVWIHTASVGEALSALPLIDFLLKEYPTYSILITSGTITSAELLSERLPNKVIHQYVPIDYKTWVKRFIKYWNPTIALLIESELWPNIINELSQAKIPMGLINARLSDESFRKWLFYRLFTGSLFKKIAFVMAQSQEYADKYAQLGVKLTLNTGNLKFSSPALPIDQDFLQQLKITIGTRKTWVACSTHEGEELMVAKIHQELQEIHKNILTIIVPRHPQRSQEIQNSLRSLGLEFACRSNQENITQNTSIYLLDTLGEMGTILHFSQIAYVGKSLLHQGGHNPLEPAKLDCAIVFGNHMENFSLIKNEMLSHKCAIEVSSQEELTSAINTLLLNDNYRNTQIQKAKIYSTSQLNSINKINDILKEYI